MFNITIYNRERANSEDAEEIEITNNISRATEHLLENESVGLVNCIRCAAHTIQLAANDVLKMDFMNKNIALCHKLAVALRKPNTLAKINQKGLRQPILNVPTRWMSSYDMVKRLVIFKDFCQENQYQKDLRVGNSLWHFMDEFLKLFEPMKKATVKVQEAHLCYGDFYKIWLTLKLEVARSSVTFADILITKIEEREKLLLENDVMVSAMYLDPRFNFMLTNDQRTQAQNHLKELCHATMELDVLEGPSESIPQPHQHHSNQASANYDTSGDELTEYLNNLAQSRRLNGETRSNLILIIKFT